MEQVCKWIARILRQPTWNIGNSAATIVVMLNTEVGQLLSAQSCHLVPVLLLHTTTHNTTTAPKESFWPVMETLCKVILCVPLPQTQYGSQRDSFHLPGRYLGHFDWILEEAHRGKLCKEIPWVAKPDAKVLGHWRRLLRTGTNFNNKDVLAAYLFKIPAIL